VKLDRAANNLDSRAFVKLRLGRLEDAIADYDAALTLQPKLAFSLYGRGVAKLRAGRKAEGQADIDAARSLTPAIEEQGKKIGLTP
jgi:tetratricopeptide (TPR) repeat protein